MTTFLSTINAAGPLYTLDRRATEATFLAPSTPLPLACSAAVGAGVRAGLSAGQKAAVNNLKNIDGGGKPYPDGWDGDDEINTEQMY